MLNFKNLLFTGISLILTTFPVAPFADEMPLDPVAPTSSVSSDSTPESLGLERATGERLATAVAHYSRARSLLIAAIAEFDKGYKTANPDALLVSKEWRATLIERAEELQKVIDPQPRVTRGGVKFSADTRLLNEASR